jgi:hypothetical protein
VESTNQIAKPQRFGQSEPSMSPSPAANADGELHAGHNGGSARRSRGEGHVLSPPPVLGQYNIQYDWVMVWLRNNHCNARRRSNNYSVQTIQL